MFCQLLHRFVISPHIRWRQQHQIHHIGFCYPVKRFFYLHFVELTAKLNHAINFLTYLYIIVCHHIFICIHIFICPHISDLQRLTMPLVMNITILENYTKNIWMVTTGAFLSKYPLGALCLSLFHYDTRDHKAFFWAKAVPGSEMEGHEGGISSKEMPSEV